MLAISSLSEDTISELIGESHVEIVTLLLLERRPVLIVGHEFHRVDMGEDFDGAPISVSLERTGWTVEGMNRDGTIRNNPSSVKILRELFPVIRGELGTVIDIYAGGQAKTPEDPVVYQGPFPFVVGVDTSVQPLVEVVFLAVKFMSDGQPPWALLSLDLDVDPAGDVYS